VAADRSAADPERRVGQVDGRVVDWTVPTLGSRGLPPELRTSFVLTKLDTVNPLPSAITGVGTTAHPRVAGGNKHGHGLAGKLAHWLDLIEDEIEETSGPTVEWLESWLEKLLGPFASVLIAPGADLRPSIHQIAKPVGI